MGDAFTKRNHYNPCFWTALWNLEYFSLFLQGSEASQPSREQLVWALSAKAGRIYQTKTSAVHYDKDLGVAEITPESMRKLLQRKGPEKHPEVLDYLEGQPESLYVDFEDILKAIEKTEAYMTLMSTARSGRIPSFQEKCFLAGFIVYQALRSHEMMLSMLESAGNLGIEKWEYFVKLKGAWSAVSFLAPAVADLSLARWTLYRSQENRFPLCDSPIMIEVESIMAVLSPRLLLEVDRLTPAGDELCRTRDGISGKKRSEFRQRAIANTYKEVIFSDQEELERWRASPEFTRRMAALADPVEEHRLTANGAARVASLLGYWPPG